MAKDHRTNITAYWLLGFIEGEGCFSINRGNNYRLDLILGNTYSNLELIQNWQVYLANLPGTNGNYAGAMVISSVTSKNPPPQSVVRIETTLFHLLPIYGRPFLDSLHLHSKKRLDFQDCKNILILREHGHHRVGFSRKRCESNRSNLK